jgi:hypothetical protein
MNLKALAAAAIGAVLLAANTEPRLPAGWSRQATPEADRACTAGMDRTLFGGNRRWLSLDCRGNVEGYISVLQTVAADRYRGKRVRFSARLKTEDVRGWSGLWMGVSTPDQRLLAFDDMSTRPLRDDNDWRNAQVTLDVDPAAAAISFGLRLTDGTGRVLMDDVRFEEVGPDDPELSIRLRPALPLQPQNLELAQ